MNPLSGPFARRAAAAALLLAAAAGGNAIAAQQTYRYIDDKGTVVLDDHVPPEYVKNGYTVLSPDGRVVREVPPVPTGEEGRRQREAAAEAERLRAWDESLLRRYSSVADIEAARDRAVRDYNMRISILKSNLLSIKGQIERELARAADIERRGGQVPASLSDTIAALRQEVEETESTLRLREQEVAAVEARYQRDIDRFRELKDVVEWRRRRQAGG
ncbi:MAG: DUF4124 domain-containing protein [Spongiibacteraceae bacterium]|nr:DUF4124 domain-containing protein [Spongiibacteraceae bacterium]